MKLRIDGEPKKPRLLSVWAPSTIKGLLAAPAPGRGRLGGCHAGRSNRRPGPLVNTVEALLGFIDPAWPRAPTAAP